MPSKTLANYGAPTINGLAAGYIIANTALENIYGGEIETGGRGCTQKFSTDTRAAQIRVVRPLPLPIDARELGSSINGGNFSAYSYQPESDEYGLDIITVIDDQVDIPDVRMDMIPVDILKMYVQNISDKVVLNINAIKIAARVYTCFSAEQADETSAYIVKKGSSDKILDKVIEANGKLNKGDREHGVATFPVKDRIGLLQNDQYTALLTSSGVFNIGGANYGYDILRKGGLDAEAGTPELLDNGFLGVIGGVPFHFVNDLVIETVCKYLGFPSNTFDSVYCHVASAHGNLFGLATGNSVNTIPSPLGQGVRLQPKYRMGAACIMPKSVSWLVDDTKWVNPYDLKDIFATGVTWSYKAPGSRQILTAGLKAESTSKHFTPSCKKLVKAADGSTSESAVTTNIQGAWVVSTSAITSIEGFLAAYTAEATKKGTFASTAFGVEQTLSEVAANDEVYMLVIDADGTVCDIVHDKSN